MVCNKGDDFSCRQIRAIVRGHAQVSPPRHFEDFRLDALRYSLPGRR